MARQQARRLERDVKAPRVHSRLVSPAIGPDGKPETVHQIRLGRARAPRCVRLWRLRRWRWDITSHTPAQTTPQGLYDGIEHQRWSFGYAFTRTGALRLIGRALLATRNTP